jgi:ribosomal protein S18 acetylase RimI-like enzyme
MEYHIRQAESSDKLQIARTFAHSFEKEFALLIKDMERIAKALESGTDADRFLVAEHNGKIVGIIACADCTGRAVYPNRKDCVKHLGFIRGLIGYKVFTDDFTHQLIYPATTGYIEFVGVLAEARGQGIARAMLEEIVKRNPQYTEFILDVTDVNVRAQQIYEKFGFAEFDRVPVKWAKQMGHFNAKVYMKYTRVTIKERE